MNEEKKKITLRRKIISLTVFGLAVMMALIALAVIFFPIDSLKQQITDAVESETGFNCEIEKMRGNILTGNVSMYGFKISRNQKLLIAIDKAELEVSIPSLLGYFLGSEPQINSVTVDKGVFNTDILDYNPHRKPSGQSTANKTTPPAAETGKPLSEDYSPSRENNSIASKATKINIKSILLSNIELRGKNSASGKSPFIMNSGQIIKESDTRYIYRIEMKAVNSEGSVMVDGEALNVSFPDFSNATITNVSKAKNINIADVYEILGLQNLTKDFNLTKTDFNLSVTHKPSQLEVAGTIEAATLQAAKTPVFNNPKITLNISYYQQKNQIEFHSLEAKSQNGFGLTAKGSITSVNNKIELNADISKSELPTSMLLDIIGKPEYSLFSRGNISLSGNLNNLGNFWRYKGEVSTDGLFLPFSPQTKGKVFADINCDQEKKLLSVTGIDIKLGIVSAKGFANIPLGLGSKVSDIGFNLSGDISLTEFSALTGIMNTEGRVSWEISSEKSAGLNAVYNVSAKTLTPIKIHVPDELLPLHIDKGELTAQGSYNLKDQTLALKSLSLKSSLLNLNLNLKGSGSDLSGVYSTNAAIAALRPLIVYFLPKTKDIMAPVTDIASTGKIKFDVDTGKFDLSESLSSVTLTNSRILRFQADSTINHLTAFALTAKIKRYNLINSGKVLLDGSAAINCRIPQNTPNEISYELKGNTRGSIRELFLIRNIFIKDDYSLTADGTIAANLNFTKDKEHHVMSVAFNSNSPELVSREKILFKSGKLLGQIYCDKNPNTGKVKIHRLYFDAEDKKILVDGSGELNTLNGISGAFNLNSTMNLEYASKMLPIFFKDSPRISGLVSGNINLAGSLDKPVLQITANSNDIVIDNGLNIRNIIKPRMMCKMSWDQTPQGPRKFLFNPLVFQTDNESLTIKGVSEKIDLSSKEKIGFGDGAAFNFLVSGNRKLLSLFIPQAREFITEQGPADALKINGTIRTRSLPLLTDKPREILAAEMTISDGQLSLDQCTANNVTVSDIHSHFSLVNGIFSLQQGSINCGGKVSFSSNIDFGQTPARGEALFSSEGLSIKAITSGLPQGKLNFYDGTVVFPEMAQQNQTKVVWVGDSVDEIKKSLTVEKSTLKGSDIRLTAQVKKPDLEKFLSYDMHESVAKEIARRFNDKIGKKYDKPVDVYYRYFDLVYHVTAGVLYIDSCKIGGGNTADFIVKGTAGFDTGLNLSIIPVRNLGHTIDMSLVEEEPQVKNLLKNLNQEQKEKIFGIIPNWLEDAARGRKLIIPVKGTIMAPIVDPKGFRDTIIAELPDLIKRASNVLNREDILQGILGKDNMKDLGKLFNNIK